MTDLPSSSPQVSKATYAALMAVTCVLAVAGAWGIAGALGGDADSCLLAGACVATASVMTFLPAFLTRPMKSGGTNFGMLVMIASMLRLLTLFAVALFFDQTRELVRRPYWIGILTGGGLILVVESAVAVMLLSRLEPRKPGVHPAVPPQA